MRSREGELRWQCVQLAIETEAGDAGVDCSGSETVFDNGRSIGHVSSGAFGHTVGESLAFAYIDPVCAVPGTSLDVMVLGVRRPARVLSEPLYDPGSERPRA